MRPPNTPWRLGALDVPPMYRTRAPGDRAAVGRSKPSRWLQIAWIPACAGMTEGSRMAQVVEMVGRADFGVDGDRSPPPAPTELILNTVALSLISPRRSGAEGGRREHLGENSHLRVRSRPASVIPAQAGIQATAQHPVAPRRSRRSTDVSNARAGRSGAVGQSKPSRWLQIAWIPACAGMTEGSRMAQVVEMVGRADFGVDGDRSPPPAPTELILNTVALSLISPRRSGAEGGRREHLGENSHRRIRSRPASVIPAQAGIHATAQHPVAPRRSRRSTDVSNARAGRSSAVGQSKPSRWLQIAWIPACAGMTEGWEWRKSLKWSGVRTSESMVTVRPRQRPLS